MKVNAVCVGLVIAGFAVSNIDAQDGSNSSVKVGSGERNASDLESEIQKLLQE